MQCGTRWQMSASDFSSCPCGVNADDALAGLPFLLSGLILVCYTSYGLARSTTCGLVSLLQVGGQSTL